MEFERKGIQRWFYFLTKKINLFKLDKEPINKELEPIKNSIFLINDFTKATEIEKLLNEKAIKINNTSSPNI
jgi:hypothetical protein